MNYKCGRAWDGCQGGFVPVDSCWGQCTTGKQKQPTRPTQTACAGKQENCTARKACTENIAATERCAEQRTRTNNCPSAAAENSQGACCPTGKKGKTGIVRVDMQELCALYAPDAALKAGTLYEELHKPMNGYALCGGLCADDEQVMAFVLWELRLYLDTHPDDVNAQGLFEELANQAGCTYATAFLNADGTAWSWTDCPWPWEYAANCK